MIRYVAWLFFIPSVSFSQALPMPIIQGDAMQTPFINALGTIQFSLPPGHRPITTDPQTGYLIQWSDQQNLDAFPSGVCPVKCDDGAIYFIDALGKKVADLGKRYDRIGPFYEGYCQAWEKIEGREAWWLVYLDATGKNAFGKRKYWEADPFSEGYAAVQPDENGEWGFIDRTGEMVVHLDKSMIGEVVTLGAFSNGLARVFMRGEQTGKYSHRYRYYFVDTRGRVALDLDVLFPGAEFHAVSDFHEGLARVTLTAADKRRTQTVWIDADGFQMFSLAHVTGVVPFHNDQAIVNFEIPQGKGVYHLDAKFVDKRGRLSELPMDTVAHSVIRASYLTDDYYVVEGTNRRQREFATLVFSRRDHSMAYNTTGDAIGFYKTFMLVKHKATEELELIRLPGTVLWRTPLKNKLFTDIADALTVKDSVKRFDLFFKKEFPAALPQLKNLETLKINFCDFTELPAGLGALTHLKKLELSNLKYLSALPEDLVNLIQLEYLSVHDCKRIRNLEAIVEKLPALRVLDLQNVEVSIWFKEKMKEKNPKLKIESSSLIMLDEGIMLEEE